MHQQRIESAPSEQKGAISFGGPGGAVLAAPPIRTEHDEARVDTQRAEAHLKGMPPPPLTPLPWEQSPSATLHGDASSLTPASSQVYPVTLTAQIEPSNGAFGGRARVRHSFDVFADQLPSLREIALAREVRMGQRVRLGDVVQEALDRFIADEHAHAPAHKTEDQHEERNVEVPQTAVPDKPTVASPLAQIPTGPAVGI